VSRVPRTSLPDGYFHVSGRGVDRATPLFHDARDRTSFLDLLDQTVRRHGWTCHALCVLTTHYHLVVECTQRPWSYSRYGPDGL
jgi:REP element-mobilizing transposase RayT